MLNFFKRFFKKKASLTLKDDLDILMDLVRSLNPLDFKHVHSSDLSNFAFLCLSPNIKEFTHYITYCSECLSENVAIPSFKLRITPSLVYLHDFFLTGNGTFLDEKKEIENFKSSALRFLTFYRAGENNEQINEFNHQHNLRVLSGLYQNLAIVIERLKQVSLSQ